MSFLQVMAIPGKSVQVEANDGDTLADVIARAGMTLAGFTISTTPDIRGANGSTLVGDTSIVCLTREVKGA